MSVTMHVNDILYSTIHSVPFVMSSRKYKYYINYENDSKEFDVNKNLLDIINTNTNTNDHSKIESNYNVKLILIEYFTYLSFALFQKRNYNTKLSKRLEKRLIV